MPDFSYYPQPTPPQSVSQPPTPVSEETSYTKPNTTLTTVPSPFPTILKADVPNPLDGILPAIVDKIAQVVPPKKTFSAEEVEEMIQRAVDRALAARATSQ